MIEAGQQRGREGVAAMSDDHRPAAGPLAGDQRRQAGDAAAPGDLLRPAHIVDLHDGHRGVLRSRSANREQ
jgi:hypothetical protein